MSSGPDVSVVIGTVNRCDSLGRTLESLAKQQLPDHVDFEVIVVDNNSTDETRAVVERVVKGGFTRVQYEFEARQGVSYSRNSGIRRSRSPIVAFTDDDNDVSPDWIATIVETFARRPDVDVIGGPILPRWPTAPPQWLDRRHWSPVAIVDYGAEAFRSTAANPVCLLTANLAVRRAAFDRIGGFSPDFPRGQDHEFLIRFWRAGGQALYLPGLVAYARVQPERLDRGYHRAWHARHGRIAARMRLQEIVGPAGALLGAPVAGLTLCGTPAFVYRELLEEAGCFLAALPRRQPSVTFHHANRVRYLAGYVRQRSASQGFSGRQGIRELFTIIAARLRAAATHLPLPIWRMALVWMLMAVLIGGSIYDILTNREHWPLSPYPMFSTVDLAPAMDSLRLFGVTRESVPREIPLLDDELIKPFDQCRLSTALQGTYNNLARRPLTDTLLRDVLLRYETRRVNREHSGPPLQAVRAYRLTWTLDSQARNVDSPDVKRLLAEVRP
jgi:GT2 family glycosyltransferase